MHTGFYPSTFLQPVNGRKTQSWIEFWISISSSLLKYFLLYVCLENRRLIFYSFTPLFLLYKPQIPTKQTCLTNCFVILSKNLCSCVQKIKNKHDGDTLVFFFVSACYSWHSEIPHSQRNIYRKMKEEITSQKKPFIAKKKRDSKPKETFAFFILLNLSRLLSSE